METHWPAIVCLFLVIVCGIFTASASKGEWRYNLWIVAAVLFVLVAAILMPGSGAYTAINLILVATLAFSILFGFGVMLGSWILSSRTAWRQREKIMAEDGFNFSNDR